MNAPFPATRDALHAYVRDATGLTIAREPVVPGHSAPFDYIAHAFFEGRDGIDPGAPGGTADAVVWANRAGGKTLLGALATVLDLVFKPGIEVRVLAGSLDQARRMHAHLRRLLSRPAFEGLIDGAVTERRVRLVNGSEVELLAQSQTSVRGTRVQKLRCDEVELFDPGVWEAAQLVTSSRVVRMADGREILVPGAIECLSTMHLPFGVMHDLVEDARAGRRRLFRWGVLDVLERCGEAHACRGERGVCALWGECGGRAKAAGREGHLRVDDALRMKSRVSLPTREAEMLCLRAARSHSVYPEFSVREHVAEMTAWEAAGEAPALRVAGMDFGYRAPTVIVYGALDGEGRLWITDERVASGTVLSEHVRGLLAHPSRPAWVGVDPAGGQTDGQTGRSAIDVMRASGLRVRARPAPVRAGIELVRSRLRPASGAGARLFIHARCTSLIAALSAYHYPADDPASVSPVKDGPDHACDALRYLVTNLDLAHGTSLESYLRRRTSVSTRSRSER